MPGARRWSPSVPAPAPLASPARANPAASSPPRSRARRGPKIAGQTARAAAHSPHQSPAMTHVVLESCIRCKYTDCVDVCPVDCFREGPNFLVIDPDECIDCTLCVAECPVDAIFAEDDVPDDQKDFTAINAELSKVWKPIIERKPGPPDADDWKDVKQKRHLLER